MTVGIKTERREREERKRKREASDGMLLLCLFGCGGAAEVIESDAEPAINVVVYVEEFIANSLGTRFLLQSFRFGRGAVLVSAT